MPRWLSVVAWAAFCVTVPSALWRVLMIVGLMPGTSALRAYELGDDHTLGYVYVLGLSIVQLATSFLTVGLARRWGVIFLGRRVPRLPVLVIATLGGVAVTWLFTVSMTTQVLTGHRPDAGHVHGAALVVMVACYLPIAAWGPLELLATWGYCRRPAAPEPTVSIGEPAAAPELSPGSLETSDRSRGNLRRVAGRGASVG